MSIRSYVVLITLLAFVAFAMLALVGVSPSQEEFVAFGVMLLIGALAHSMSYQSASGSGASVALIPFFACIILVPGWPSVVSVAIPALLLEVRSKREALKATFNVAQVSLAAASSALVFIASGGVSPLDVPGFDLGQLSPLCAAFATYLLVNKVAVSGAIGIASGGGASLFIARVLDTSLLYDVFSLPLAYGYARALSDLGAVWSLILAIPLLGVRQLYRTNWQLQRTSEELLQILVKAIEARDPYTSGHSQRVAHYATIIARSIGMKRKQVDRIFAAAILHDVGKIYEDFAPILRKPSSLTPEERAVIESHSERGAQLVSTVSQLEDIVPVVRHHHERWDGRGYPSKISGQDIPLGSRIIMLADTIDAMTSDRPYRPALSREVVLAELDRMSGIQFDPDMTRRFLASSGCDELFAAVATHHAGATAVSDPTAPREKRRFRIA